MLSEKPLCIMCCEFVFFQNKWVLQYQEWSIAVLVTQSHSVTVLVPSVSSSKFADELRFGDFSVHKGAVSVYTACFVKIPDI